MSIIRGKLYNLYKNKQGGTGANQYNKEQSLHFEDSAKTAEILAKVRIGELLKDIPKAKENQHTKKVLSSTAATKQEKAEELGFSKFDTSRFQQLADNKDIVEDVIENSEDIPTQTECLKKIQDKKMKHQM